MHALYLLSSNLLPFDERLNLLAISSYELLGCIHCFIDPCILPISHVLHFLLLSSLLKSSAKPADWKYQSGLLTSWLSLECTVHINIHIPLSTTSASYTLEKNTKVSR